MTEKQLIKAIAEGREEAYQQLYEQHYSVLCSMAYNYLGDTLLAEEAVSEVIVNLWIKRQRLEIRTSLRRYLVTSVRNRCLNYIGSKTNRVERQLSALGSIDLSFSIDSNHPLGHLLEEELEEEIKEAIAKIPNESRQVFMLSRYHDMTYAEIAEKLGITTNTVKYHIKQSLSILRNELEGYLGR